jgi:hypothetical protein
MKVSDRVDKWMGLVTLMTETLTKIKPTETVQNLSSLRFVTRTSVHGDRQEDNGVRPIHV